MAANKDSECSYAPSGRSRGALAGTFVGTLVGAFVGSNFAFRMLCASLKGDNREPLQRPRTVFPGLLKMEKRPIARLSE